jgi:hypothetical protein
MDTGTSSKQVYQKETVEPEQLSSTIKFDSNLPPTIQQTKPHISSSITHKDVMNFQLIYVIIIIIFLKNSHESTYRYIEVPNATEQDLATASTSDQKFSSHPKISKNKSKRIGRKSLFSSEESDEEANQLVLNSAQRKRNSHSPQMEKKQQEEKVSLLLFTIFCYTVYSSSFVSLIMIFPEVSYCNFRKVGFGFIFHGCVDTKFFDSECVRDVRRGW